LLPNYFLGDSPSNFADAASTALIAASAYRLSVLWGVNKWIPFAESARQELFGRNSTDELKHFDNGWLTPVVNPYDVGSQGSQSPEAQAFVLELQAAWKEWSAAGVKSGNGASSLPFGNSVVAFSASIVVGLLWLF
jgi:hypothetical protein